MSKDTDNSDHNQADEDFYKHIAIDPGAKLRSADKGEKSWPPAIEYDAPSERHRALDAAYEVKSALPLGVLCALFYLAIAPYGSVISIYLHLIDIVIAAIAVSFVIGGAVQYLSQGLGIQILRWSAIAGLAITVTSTVTLWTCLAPGVFSPKGGVTSAICVFVLALALGVTAVQVAYCINVLRRLSKFKLATK